MEASYLLNFVVFQLIEPTSSTSWRTLGETLDYVKDEFYDGDVKAARSAFALEAVKIKETGIKFHGESMWMDSVVFHQRLDPWEWCGPPEFDENEDHTQESQYKEDRWMGAYTTALCDHFGIRDIPESADDFGRIAREEMWLTPETAAVEYMRSRNRLPDNW